MAPYERYRGLITQQVLGLGGSPPIADEVVEAVFTELSKGIQTFERTRHHAFRTWL